MWWCIWMNIMPWRNNISFKKNTEKVVLLQYLIKTIVKFRAENILCTFVSCTKYIKAYLWYTICLVYDFWKRWYHKVHISPRCMRCTKSLNKTQKNTRISNYFRPAIDFIWTSDLYRYKHCILTEGRNFKTFLKEN